MLIEKMATFGTHQNIVRVKFFIGDHFFRFSWVNSPYPPDATFLVMMNVVGKKISRL